MYSYLSELTLYAGVLYIIKNQVVIVAKVSSGPLTDPSSVIFIV